MEELKEKASLVSWVGKGQAREPEFVEKILAAVQGGGQQRWVVLGGRDGSTDYQIRRDGLEELGAELIQGLELLEARHA
jgi:hypothetical protein